MAPVVRSVLVIARRRGARACRARARACDSRDQLAIDDVVDLVVLFLAMVDRDRDRHVRLGEQPREIEPARLPVIDHLPHVEHLHLADHLVEGAVADRRHELAHFLGDEEEVVDDVLRLAAEALAQHRVLRGDADRTGVEMALAHHDAARGNQAARWRSRTRRRRAARRRRRRGRCGCRRRPARRCGRAADWRPASGASRRARSPTASRRA